MEYLNKYDLYFEFVQAWRAATGSSSPPKAIRNKLATLLAKIAYLRALKVAAANLPDVDSRGHKMTPVDRSIRIVGTAAANTFLQGSDVVWSVTVSGETNFENTGSTLRRHAMKAVQDRIKNSILGKYNAEIVYEEWLVWTKQYDQEFTIAQSEADRKIERILEEHRLSAIEFQKKQKEMTELLLSESRDRNRKSKKKKTIAVQGSPAERLRAALRSQRGHVLDGGVRLGGKDAGYEEPSPDPKRFYSKRSVLLRFLESGTIDDASRRGSIEILSETSGLRHGDPTWDYVVHDDFTGPLLDDPAGP